MTHLQALILGIIQGLTEFFPISSSAHLKLAKLLFHIQESEGQVMFDLFCHLGTLLVLIAFFHKVIVRLFSEDRKKLRAIALAILPLFPAYFLLKPLRQAASQSHLLGFFLIGTGLLLFVAENVRLRAERKRGDSLWIGAAQALALIPGVSRSASTISCAHVLGWSSQEAVQFSFLLSIPTVMGGHVLELAKLLHTKDLLLELSFSSCLIGFLSSLAVGAIVVRFALNRLSEGRFKPFAWYCVILGIVSTYFLNR